VALAAPAALLGLRARRRRRVERFWLLPSRVEEAPPEAVPRR
jgi:hypothetical protein